MYFDCQLYTIHIKKEKTLYDKKVFGSFTSLNIKRLQYWQQTYVFTKHISRPIHVLQNVRKEYKNEGRHASVLRKLTVFQQVKEFPTFCGSRRFITAITTARQLSLSRNKQVQPKPFCKIHYGVTFLSTPRSFQVALSSVSQPKLCVYFSSSFVLLAGKCKEKFCFSH